MNRKYNVAIIGATGNTGRETLNILAERNFPVNEIHGVASSSSTGSKVSFGDKEITIKRIEAVDFSRVDIAFFAAGSEVAKTYAKNVARKGCIIIDKSSYFRNDSDVPLVVPEVNPEDIKLYKNKNIIASPNCCATPLALVLKPLDDIAKVKRVVISTYQSVSGKGKAGTDELYRQTKSKYMFGEVSSNVFPQQIAFNLFPHIGDFSSDGYSDEEQKISAELNKIMGKHIKSSVTCVRVPTFIGHAMSINIEFIDNMNALKAEKILSKADGLYTLNRKSTNNYSTPIDVVDEDAVHIGRIRDDLSQSNTINLWLVGNNLRKGAALNCVQIAEHLVKILP